MQADNIYALRHWFISQCCANGVGTEACPFMVGDAEGERLSDTGNAYGDPLVPYIKIEREEDTRPQPWGNVAEIERSRARGARNAGHITGSASRQYPRC